MIFSVLFSLEVASQEVKYNFIWVVPDHRIESDIIVTLTAPSASQCMWTCVNSAACMACNWQETTGACEHLGNQFAPVHAEGFAMHMSK